MIRSFLPVGQGAFYLEQFNTSQRKINIIYDCGSLTDIKNVEREIEKNFLENEIIDAVFISHFDADHINGLEILLKYCNIKKLFFPLITEELREAYYLEDLINNAGNIFAKSFIKNPYKAISSLPNKKRPIMFQIRGFREEQDTSNNDVRIIDSGVNITGLISNDDEADYSKISNWKYIPYNFKQKDRLNQFKSLFFKKTHKQYSHEEVEWEIKHNSKFLNDLKKIYKEIDGTLNTNSMTLLSYCTNGIISQSLYEYQDYFYQNYNFCYNNFRRIPNGCLYTGDCDASSEEFMNDLVCAYQYYIDYIGLLQVPHHGSKYSYNSRFMSWNNLIYCIISSGISNKYKHPHSYVIKDILLNQKIPMIITEDPKSEIIFITDYKRKCF